MGFKNLAEGQPFFILQKNEGKRPLLQTGVVKSRTEPKSPYSTNTPAIFNGLSAMQGQNLVVDIIVNVGNTDVPFNNLPADAESSSYNNGNTFVSYSREATMQAVDGMIQLSKKAKELQPYHDAVIEEGEKMLETLNPRYKEEKQRDRSIRELQQRQDEQDKKLDKILSRLDNFFTPAKEKNP